MTADVEQTIQVGGENAGGVTFQKSDDASTCVAVQTDFVPEGVQERRFGEALGLTDRHVKADLERFKQFTETRGRGTVDGAATSRAKG